MNTDPLTEAELARVIELDALWGSNEATMSQSWAAENELALLCPRLARELIATREKLRVAREAAGLIREATSKRFGAVPTIAESSTTGQRDVVWTVTNQGIAQLNQP